MLELYNLQECIDLYEYDYEREALILPGDNAARMEALYDMAGATGTEKRYLSDYAAAMELLDRLSHGVKAEWFSENAKARALYRKALDTVGQYSPRYSFWARHAKHSARLSEIGNAQWFLDIAIQCFRNLSEEDRKQSVPKEIDYAAIHFGFGMYLRNQFLRGAKRHFLLFDSGADNVIDRVASIMSPEHDFLGNLSETAEKDEMASNKMYTEMIHGFRKAEPDQPWMLTLPEDYETLTAWKNDSFPARFSTHPALNEIIDNDGNPRCCPGLMAALRLSHPDRMRIARLQAHLHELLGDALAKPLPLEANLFPLHPLSKLGDEWMPDEWRFAGLFESIDMQDEKQRQDTSQNGREKFEIKRNCPIRFTADRIVNWKGQYLALLIRPERLMDYNKFRLCYYTADAILPLPRDEAIPRIALAYFRPGEVDGSRLESAILAVEAQGLIPETITLARDSFSIQSYADLYHYRDRFPSICCCDDDGSRSVMAAALLNHRAKLRDIPLRASARRTQVTLGVADTEPKAVLQILEGHGVDIPKTLRTVPDILRDEETTIFSDYAMMSLGSLYHAIEMTIPLDRMFDASQILYGAGETQDIPSLEAVYDDLSKRVDRLLDEYEKAIQMGRCEKNDSERGL